MAQRALGFPSPFPAAGQGRNFWLSVGFALLGGFVVLAALINNSDVPTADRDVADWIRAIDFWSWDSLISIGEGLTGAPGGVIVWFAAVVIFWVSGRPVEAIILAFAAAIWLPKAIAEEVVSRSRPVFDGIDGSNLADGHSFPSGHLTAGIAVYGMLGVIAAVRITSWRPRILVIGVVEPSSRSPRSRASSMASTGRLMYSAAD
jgi:membrane-associated phospholipid phosphatase